jgi:dienelactone hydrolase
MVDSPVPGFEAHQVALLGTTRTVYRRGEGPPVLVMHEIPGITPPVARFARRVADAGFSVAMPCLFGTPMRPMTIPYMAGVQARLCISHEFALLAERKPSAITEWLRALCRTLHEEHGGASVGAIGMCVTGNFALALMVDPWLMAPVLSQPSLPLALTRSAARALHVSDEQLLTIKRRARDEDVHVLAMRFTHDRLCPGARFQRLRDELGERFEAIEIDSGPGNPHRIGRMAHSVVTQDLVDREGHPTRAALDRVLAFFHERLDR